MSVIAYTYDADTHCVTCTVSRFGGSASAGPPEDSRDSEGNFLHPIFRWDEWCEPEDGEQTHTLACSTCYSVIAEHENENWEEGDRYEDEDDGYDDDCNQCTCEDCDAAADWTPEDDDPLAGMMMNPNSPDEGAYWRAAQP